MGPSPDRWNPKPFGLRGSAKTVDSTYKGVVRILNQVEGLVAVKDQKGASFDIYICGKSNLRSVLHGDTVIVKVTGQFQGRLTRRSRGKKVKPLQENENLPEGEKDQSNSKFFRETESIFDSENSSEGEVEIQGECGSNEIKPSETCREIEESSERSPNSSNLSSNSNSRIVPPRYNGIVVKVFESVTEKSPIVGFIQPFNYYLKIQEEARLKKELKASGRRCRAPVLTFQILRRLGIYNDDSKLRTILDTGEINTDPELFTFVPIISAKAQRIGFSSPLSPKKT
ncbi:ssd1p/F48E8.6-like RNAseII [Cryptosporidium felis]|nr:ssd1p/F48E8.6-like RNAseII [Cryptosporidium felis]